MRLENDKLIQHQNMKQKLQYHVKIKKENNELKEEIRALREMILQLQQSHGLPITHFAPVGGASDKENLSAVPNGPPPSDV